MSLLTQTTTTENKSMNAIKNMERVHNVIENSLFMVTGKLDYDRVTDAIIVLANLVHGTDDDEVWTIGEHGNCDLTGLLIGAYWHYTYSHTGQASKGYAALSALGLVYRPGMASGPEEGSTEADAFASLNDMEKESR